MKTHLFLDVESGSASYLPALTHAEHERFHDETTGPPMETPLQPPVGTPLQTPVEIQSQPLLEKLPHPPVEKLPHPPDFLLISLFSVLFVLFFFLFDIPIINIFKIQYLKKQ